MELTFLGTSAGVPTRERNLSALALRPGERSLWTLFDCGEGTQQQILKTPLSLYSLERIFITHLHGDHLYGLFGILASRAMLRCEAPLEIFAPAGLATMLEAVMVGSDLHLPYPLTIRELQGGERLSFDAYDIDVVPLSHSITCFGFVYQEPARPPSVDMKRAREMGLKPGPLIGRLKRGETVVTEEGVTVEPEQVLGPERPGVRVLIGGDNDRPELFAPYGPADLMIHEATYTQADYEALARSYRHSTARQVAEAAQRLGAAELILTHISARYDSDGRLRELIEEAERYFQGPIALAHDFMTLHR